MIYVCHEKQHQEQTVSRATVMNIRQALFHFSTSLANVKRFFFSFWYEISAIGSSIN